MPQDDDTQGRNGELSEEDDPSFEVMRFYKLNEKLICAQEPQRHNQ